MSRTLTIADIAQIDNWLKNQGVKYIEMRYELLDHLATEFESLDNHIELRTFLYNRRVWCRTALKEKQKAIISSMTKAFFKKLLGFFTITKMIFPILMGGIILFYIKSVFDDEVAKNVLFYVYLLLILYQLHLMIFSGVGHHFKKESVSVAYLTHIFIFSQLPLFWLGLFPEEWWLVPIFYIPFLSFNILLALAAILTFHEKKSLLLKNLEVFKKQFQ